LERGSVHGLEAPADRARRAPATASRPDDLEGDQIELRLRAGERPDLRRRLCKRRERELRQRSAEVPRRIGRIAHGHRRKLDASATAAVATRASARSSPST